MIYITGDTHGEFSRFTTSNFPEQKSMTKNDFVIVCGDFGGVWDNSPEEKHWLDWLNCKPFTTLFVDGNHENFDLLGAMPEAEWNGGKVHFIRDSVIHLMRAQIFILDNKTFFTMGGASSHDISAGILELSDPDFKRKRKQLDKQHAMYRINHVSWWQEEMPSVDEYEAALDKLDAVDGEVDYILSHCGPSRIVDIIGQGLYQHDELTEFFDKLTEWVDFNHWFFGHYHDNRTILQKYTLLYEQIIKL